MTRPSIPLYPVLLLAHLLGTSATQAQPPAADFPAAQESPAGMLLVQSEDDVPAPVNIQEVVYATRDGMNLELKILSPAGIGGGFGDAPSTSAPKPLVI